MSHRERDIDDSIATRVGILMNARPLNTESSQNEAGLVSLAMFRRWAIWALETKNIYLWCFGLLQWNIMARTKSVGVLLLHNFLPRQDCIVWRNEEQNSVQGGDELQDKFLFSNPFQPSLDLYLALAVWLSVDPGRVRVPAQAIHRRQGSVTS